MRNTKVLSGLSLFSGAGGMDVGFIDASCKLVVLNAADFGVAQARERMFLIGFQKMAGLENLETLFEMRRKPSPVVRDILLPLGLAGSENNQRVCNAKVSIATRPVLRKSPYAGMLFNGQGRPLNPDRVNCLLNKAFGVSLRQAASNLDDLYKSFLKTNFPFSHV
jgi:C-5 cytosine-specific DNA methylase